MTCYLSYTIGTIIDLHLRVVISALVYKGR